MARKPSAWSAGRRAGGSDPLASCTSLAAGTEAGADWYDASFQSDDGDHYRRPYWEVNWYAALAVVADRSSSRRAAVLDMGCGPAPLALILRDRGAQHYLGFDFSAARLEFARSRLPEYRFELADVYETDLFETEDYNVVLGLEEIGLVHVGELEPVFGKPRTAGSSRAAVPSRNPGSAARRGCAGSDTSGADGQPMSSTAGSSTA